METREVIAECVDDATGLRIVDAGDGTAEVHRIREGAPRPYGSLDYTDPLAHVAWGRAADEEPGYVLDRWASWIYARVGTWRSGS